MTFIQNTGTSFVWRSIFSFLLISFLFTGNVQARNTVLKGQVLKTASQGLVLNLSTNYGTLPIRYRANGTMSGNSAKIAKLVGYSSDRGRWWVSGSRLCQKWRKLFDGRSICYRISKSGNRIRWSGGGRSGSATLSN